MASAYADRQDRIHAEALLQAKELEREVPFSLSLSLSPPLTSVRKLRRASFRTVAENMFLR